MTEKDHIEEFTVDRWVEPGNVVTASCVQCGTPARFESSYDFSLDEKFRQQCYACDSGRFPGVGNITWFRVTELRPALETPPVAANPPPVYSSEDAD